MGAFDACLSMQTKLLFLRCMLILPMVADLLLLVRAL